VVWYKVVEPETPKVPATVVSPVVELTVSLDAPTVTSPVRVDVPATERLPADVTDPVADDTMNLLEATVNVPVDERVPAEARLTKVDDPVEENAPETVRAEQVV
jgi:hypothetical protein